MLLKISEKDYDFFEKYKNDDTMEGALTRAVLKLFEKVNEDTDTDTKHKTGD